MDHHDCNIRGTTSPCWSCGQDPVRRLLPAKTQRTSGALTT